MMRFAKKTICLMLAMLMVVGLFSSVQADAKEISIATPKVSTKLISKKTGVKITIGKTKDADGYEVIIKSTSDSEYCDSFKYVDAKGVVYMDTSLTQYIEKDGKAKRSITHKDLKPGTYTVKVRSWNNKKYGTKTYSEWSKEKKFTLKESATKGYATSYDFSKVKKGDVVTFGAYEQDLNYTNGKEPIEWIVLEKTKKSVLLLSKYALDRLPYNKNGGNVTWETCSLRKWLNNDFIKSAFNKTEQGMIKTTTIENYDNVIYETSAGNDTKDKVFLLSQLEMINSDYGFSEDYDEKDVNRMCTFAWNKGKTDIGDPDCPTTCTWWLRTPSDDPHKMVLVGNYGDVASKGGYADIGDSGAGYLITGSGVRPALYISLK